MAKKARAKDLFPKFTVYGYHRVNSNKGNYLRATNCDDLKQAKFEAEWNTNHGDEKSIIRNNVSGTEREVRKINGKIVSRVL